MMIHDSIRKELERQRLDQLIAEARHSPHSRPRQLLSNTWQLLERVSLAMQRTLKRERGENPRALPISRRRIRL